MTETDERVRELLDALEPRRTESADWEGVLARLERRRRIRIQRPALLVAAVGVSAAIALTVTAPWRGAPTILERAGAAIRSPSAAEVLYMRFEDKRSGCCRVLSAGEVRLWVEGSAPRHFRAVFPGFSAGSPLAEGGGTLDPPSAPALFRYDPQANVLEPLKTRTHVSTASFDPVAIVREALAAGRARVRGKVMVGGRQTIRIDLTGRDNSGVVGEAIYYVDAKTYQPVEIDYPRIVELRFPFEPVFGNGIYKERLRFVTFRYLPATAANLRLADIRAMHSTARIAGG
jgi:hypothetical protein